MRYGGMGVDLALPGSPHTTADEVEELSSILRPPRTLVVRTREQMLDVTEGLPRAWKRFDPAMKYNVILLRHEVDDESIIDGLLPKPGIESVAYRPGVLYWSAKSSNLAQTSMVKLAKNAIYKLYYCFPGGSERFAK